MKPYFLSFFQFTNASFSQACALNMYLGPVMVTLYLKQSSHQVCVLPMV